MPQFLRPDADTSVGTWTTTPLWDKIDEVTASDTDLVTSADNTAPDVFEVSLTNPIATPGVGTTTLTVRRSKSAVGGHDLQERFSLYQGANLIQELAQATPDSTTYASVSFIITNSASITDWNDLRVRVAREGATGGGPSGRRSLRVSWVVLEAPDAPVPISGSFSANALIKGVVSRSFTADSAFFATSSSTFAADAIVSTVFDWVAPPADAEVIADDTPTFILASFYPSGGDVVFEVLLDTVDTFDSASLRTHISSDDPTGWEYWDGAAWVVMSTGKMPVAHAGNQVRYTLQSSLTNGIWYRRAKQGYA